MDTLNDLSHLFYQGYTNTQIFWTICSQGEFWRIGRHQIRCTISRIDINGCCKCIIESAFCIEQAVAEAKVRLEFTLYSLKLSVISRMGSQMPIKSPFNSHFRGIALLDAHTLYISGVRLIGCIIDDT